MLACNESSNAESLPGPFPPCPQSFETLSVPSNKEVMSAVAMTRRADLEAGKNEQTAYSTVALDEHNEQVSSQRKRIILTCVDVGTQGGGIY
jgi:hypothetical protein